MDTGRILATFDFEPFNEYTIKEIVPVADLADPDESEIDRDDADLVPAAV